MLSAAALGRGPLDAWLWYVELLDQCNEGACRSISMPFQFYAVIGGILLHFQDPVTEWKRSWAQLFHEREEARFDTSDLRLLCPSQHLILAGLGLLALSNRGRVSDASARDLWAIIRRAIGFLSVQGEVPPRRVNEGFRATGFEVVGRLFDADWWTRAVLPELEMFRASPTMVVRIASRIARGVPRAEVRAIFAANGISLLTACNEARSVFEAQDRRVRDDQLLADIEYLESD